MAYATIADLQEVGLPPGALSGVDAPARTAALEKASAYADTFLRDKYRLPLAEPYDPSLVDAVVQIACYRLMTRRGFNPEDPGDQAVRLGRDDAVVFLTRIANGQAQLSVTQASPAIEEPRIITDPQRGYSGGSCPVGPYDGGI
jgi:phage gp36-like protein